MAADKVRYNDKVKLNDGGQGSVKYVGELVGKEGVFFGIDLVKGTGKNNGTLKGQVYFKTRGNKKSGRFIRASAVKSSKKTEHSVEFTVGDAVTVKSKGCGIVRFVGLPSFSKVPKPMYGVELDDPKGVCDGTFKKCTYFSCASKHGVYVEQSKVTAGKSTQKAGKKKKKKKAADKDDAKEDKAEKKKKKKKGDKEKPKKKKKKSSEADAEPEAEPEPEPEAETPDVEEEPETPAEQEQEEEPEADAEEKEAAADADAEAGAEVEAEAEADAEADEPEAEQEQPEDEPEPEQEQEEAAEVAADADADDAEAAEPAEAEEEEAPAEAEAEAEAEAAAEEPEESKEDAAASSEVNSVGDITEDVVVAYLKEHYAAHDSNVISPHDIAKKMMESQGIAEAQFQFHLNNLGKVTYWIVNSMQDAFGDIAIPGEGFKLVET